MEKAGVDLRWIFISGWASIAAASLYLVLSIPWIWENAPLAVRIWRICLVCALALLSVGHVAIKIWPNAALNPAEAKKQPQPSTNTPTGPTEAVPPATSDVHAPVKQVPTHTTEGAVGKHNSETKQSQLQSPIILTAAPYGNLAPRCESMGNAIHAYVESRIKKRPAVSDRDAYNDWFRLNDGQFRFHFQKDVLNIHKELADLHVTDPKLDELLDKGKWDFEFRQQHVDLAMSSPEMCHLSTQEIEQIGERFKFLATQVPH